MPVARHGRERRGSIAAVLALATIALAYAGCGDDAPARFVQPYDAGVDVVTPEPEAGPEVDPTLGGPCTEDAQCDDQIACTFDRCDPALSRCRNVPDDTLCADSSYCNGKETCVLRQGCQAGPVVTCQDDNPCTIDRCVEANKACVHAPRDVDLDGDPDDHCVQDRDCDDLDPAVSSQRTEVCDNGSDDDCDGALDETPCAKAANDVCATALAVTAPGTYLLSSIAAKKDYATSCSVAAPSSASDVVLALTVPADAAGPEDVEVRATAGDSSNEVAIALETTCGEPASETSCGHVEGVASARAIARAVAPGDTVYAVVTSQAEGALDARVDFRPAAPKPANESCAAPAPVATDTPFTVSLVDPSKDLASDCAEAKTGELTYAFTLSEPRDVRIFASTLAGPGEPVVSLRDDACSGELRCRAGTTPPLFARSLAAGTHVFSVAGTAQIDASVLVKTYPPTAAPPNQSCATAPALVPNTTFAVDLSAQEDAIKNGCLPGGPAAAYELVLTEPSDVLVVGRFPQTEAGAVALNEPACTKADTLACATGVTPQRVSKRSLPAGSYRVVVADQQGQTAQLSVFVRKATPPTHATSSDSCVAPLTIPETGGFFTGDTTAAAGDFNAGCDAPGQPIGGAPDQVMRFVLSSKRRVVFDMSGSFLTTVLDVRRGAACPGVEVPGACYVGFGPDRSFLDTTLDPGTYWVQVDGYSGAVGPWNLDVRVLPP